MNSNALLCKSIKDGDVKAVRELLVRDPAMIRGEHLFAAAEAGELEVVRYLAEYSRISLDERDESGRDVLHHAALSDNVELWDYLIRKCGMNPFRGDRELITPWELAVSNGGGRIGAYMSERHGSIEEYYKNPIRTGMFPDPSIVRVGEDYYMVNSSFVFFPCIPVSHSRDLIHWEIIGHAITNPEWAHLDELEGGRGYWAPDISYYDGRFYITATLRFNDDPDSDAAAKVAGGSNDSMSVTPYRRQAVVSSERPEGPYSEPAYIDEDGIDPSIFNDDDGRRYMLLNRGARILELDDTATRQISEARLLYYGDRKRAPEGPHLYKKDGWYYLILAEGGTGPGHMVTVQRSRTLFGDYESSPYNPIMRQSDPEAAIQRCGHGDLVDTPDGRWYMAYLCGRMLDGRYSMLGRETALDPVTWTADGWPIVNDLKGPSALQKKPYPDSVTREDARNGDMLPPEFMTPRPPLPGTIISVVRASDVRRDGNAATEPSSASVPCGAFRGKDAAWDFTVMPSAAPMTSIGCRSIVVRRQTSFKCSVSVSVFLPDEMPDGPEYGLTGYYDENTFVTFGVTYRGGHPALRVREHVGDEDRERLAEIDADACTDTDAGPDEGNAAGFSSFGRTLMLEMRVDGLKRDFYCGDRLICTLPDVYYLCDEGIRMGKRFTGAMAGIFATTNGRAGHDAHVRFKGFAYADLH